MSDTTPAYKSKFIRKKECQNPIEPKWHLKDAYMHHQLETTTISPAVSPKKHHYNTQPTPLPPFKEKEKKKGKGKKKEELSYMKWISDQLNQLQPPISNESNLEFI